MAVDSSVVKKTQESLGKIIKKPPLTEKLLTKPPFRYLHDIISEVTKASGFLDGLYSGDELTSSAIKDKDAKIAYLQKAIDAVGFAMDAPVSVRPSKIIAGQEPDKTNEFLQSLGKAAAKGKNADAVEKVKKGEKPAKKSKGKEDDKGRSKEGKERRSSSKDKADDKSKERDSSKGRGREKETKDTSKERVNASKSKERSGKDRKSRDDSKTRDSAGSKERRKPEEKKEEKKVEEKKDPESAKKEERKRRKEKKEEPEPVVMQPEPEPEPVAEAPAAAAAEPAETPTTNGFHEQEEGEGSPPPVRIPRPSSAKGQRRRPKEEQEDAPPDVERKTYAEAVTAATTAGPPVPITQGKRRERPTSARPAPPKIKKQDDEPEDLTVRQHSGRPPAGIIVDNEKPPEDDDMFINEEAEELPMAMVRSAAPVADDGQHGGLVQKILETQKNYATEDEQKDIKKQRAPLMNQAARQKERGMVKKEIDQLKVGIQTLASSAAPLGKILDYMQEDLDSMQKELETWRSENKYHETAIHAEESHMEKTLEPLRDQLSEIEHHFNDQINKINAMKSNIAHNDDKIEQMLSTMSFTAT